MTPPDGPRNTLILASAGSGKTYQLTNRYLKLLALGVDPARIIALTFTRKAAGEFFASLLEKLARCCRDPAFAASAAAQIGLDDWGPADFLPLLRRFVANMHRLALGTLDSFLLSVVRSFPFELGLGGEFEILDEHLIRLEKERVYRTILGGDGLDLDADREFVASFRQATQGHEESGLMRRLERFIDRQHAIYLEAPDRLLWGNPAAIWPEGHPWVEAWDSVDPLLEPLLQCITTPPWTASQRKRWEEFASAAREHVPGAPMPNALKYLLDKVLVAWSEIESGRAELNLQGGRRILNGEACDLLRGVVSRIMGAEYRLHLVRTQGVWKVLHEYEANYARLVRERGKLIFADLEGILSGAFPGAARPGLTQFEADSARLRIDYRLDGGFDHWLLDEFQDTSFLQWRAIRNLVDEAVQDPSCRRSLFVVGDAKQAIYGWRGGDSRLFSEIAQRYAADDAAALERITLAESYRSQLPVLEAVNRVFRDPAMLNEVAPRSSVDRWEWQEHRSALSAAPGFSCLLHPDPAEGRAKADQTDCFRVALAVLETIRPVERGLSCAVLVQRNDAGHEFVDYVRQHSDIPILCESDVSIGSDNPVTSALLALLRAAAHPSDGLALEHVRMTPLGSLFVADQPGELTNRVLRPVQLWGFEPFLRSAIDALQTRSGTPLDDFSLRRAGELFQAARLFDQTGNRSMDTFLEFAGSYQVRDLPAAGTVQVLTIHKAKGLGFDLVLLPDLDGNKLTEIKPETAVRRRPDRSVQWVCDLPPRALADADAEFHSHLEERASEVAYEALCKLYVAMTRARSGLYLIAAPSSTTSRNYRWLLDHTLGPGPLPEMDSSGIAGNAGAAVVFASGQADWFQFATPPTSAPEPPPPPPAVAEGPPPARLFRRTPSAEPASTLSGAQLFDLEILRARELGAAVHTLFEAIEWLAPGGAWDRAALPESLIASAPPEAIEQVARCLAHPEIRGLFERRNNTAVAWREKRFEVVLADTWISGAFDRVNLLRDPDGALREVVVIDFKTDHCPDGDLDMLAGRHRRQMDLYRRAAGQLTRMPLEKVRGVLVFTAMTACIDVLL
ncbi:MAG TPA: UvrD-helicase domain-containing protein [Verrucomicrobiales bacterium]|nr:UvrD-helicase domain-containing protein [Verrucomicrobiales bacterium]